jgi:hypothetical protein
LILANRLRVDHRRPPIAGTIRGGGATRDRRLFTPPVYVDPGAPGKVSPAIAGAFLRKVDGGVLEADPRLPEMVPESRVPPLDLARGGPELVEGPNPESRLW